MIALFMEFPNCAFGSNKLNNKKYTAPLPASLNQCGSLWRKLHYDIAAVQSLRECCWARSVGCPRCRCPMLSMLAIPRLFQLSWTGRMRSPDGLLPHKY